MKYKPTNKDKYLVFNPTNQTLIEKLHSAISVFHLAVRNGMEFRINDTEGIELVQYFTSEIQWWETDWKDDNYVVGSLTITDGSKNLIKTNRVMKDVQHCNVVHINSKGDFAKHIKLKPYTNKQVFDYLFEIETLYYKNYKYLFNRVSFDPHLIVNVDDMSIEQSETLIGELINRGNKVFLSTFNVDLLNQLRLTYDRSSLKSITSNTLDINNNSITDTEDVLSIVFQILLMNDISHKVISNKDMETLYVSLIERGTTFNHDSVLNLYEINQ